MSITIGGNIRGVKSLLFSWLEREPQDIDSQNLVPHVALCTARGTDLKNLRRNRDSQTQCILIEEL